MSKVAARSAVKTAIQMVHRLKPQTRLEILNFKKDRAVHVERTREGQLRVAEDGYVRQEWHVDEREAEALLKDIIPREFPRSHELRFTVKNLDKDQ
ncbi:hypothetical protein [Sulfobacillus thermosulfidooxidans]|uniref:Uncharacterized protein n=2 Tax=Sulfobacillus thermosulfidooxidans TaxID=28034 RepID=A0A1W1W7E3_SULTA|nr:hypothetical protein [Sulfobacillus thermosulfidooxidans]OLZ08164.1 hypothetical protein BFX05_05165 [Sulfobacillus thermosulfidooxidans]OLZ14976.1 hypothetical protein BFX06_05085 [Sulfobacillus thermosulfidooxidans]OLZ19665.1 hypothetical protein BFX07_03125 [Sulfobacillus thermosulfidooxidans]PSR27832.1 MAG: hypothetical protein C7B47_06985 [Sulfobacillus thermosulfidooxidans]SMC02221.1 hypothetical protein SAMN00768000_0440 [Sulfobacillus thermosulfidooxidans DSM 9293]